MYGKKTYKKYPKKTYKKGKNTSRKYKRTFKSNYGQTQIKAPVQARETFVVLPFLKTFQVSIAGSGSQTYSILGNSLIPMPSVFTGISAGDTWVSGVQEYANFYNNYKVLACKIKIQYTAVSSNNVLRVVLIPIQVGGGETAGGSVNDRITELNALTYDALAQQPFAQSRTLGISTGGNATMFLKCFRKSKHMLGVKDTKDAIAYSNLPNPDGSSGSINLNATSSFFYYTRIFNVSASAQSVEVEVRAQYFTQLTGRTNWVPVNVP